ncbi:MAG TPA: helix-turn-helix transcriptional regulator [Rhizomicrobium sp.]|nr:helix-turn-helix transcriptional regulator [Rhizomicrobium sp.]
MSSLPNVAQVGALIGDPVRAAILGALMDGSERPAGELAGLSGVSPQTASAHLARLLDGGLLAVNRHGRHRYYRLRDADVAHAIETLSVAADFAPRRSQRVDPVLKRARRCYDHVAGELGVAICDTLIADGRVIAGGDGYTLSANGRDWMRCMHLDPPPDTRRPLVRPCLDWTERRPHLAGWLGAAICTVLENEGALLRISEGRALRLTPHGAEVLRRRFGVSWFAGA